MSPSKASIKPETPTSVKWLMIIEAMLLFSLGGWMASEYQNNILLHMYVNAAIEAHFTTYIMIIGISVGLTGTFTAYTFWKNLRVAREKLEHASTPRNRRSVNKALADLPNIDEDSSTLVSTQKNSSAKIAIAAVPQLEPPPKDSQP